MRTFIVIVSMVIMAIVGHAEEYMFSNDFSEIEVSYKEALIAGKKSQFIVHEDVPLEGTSKMGEVMATFESLVEIFGEPIETNTRNTDIEWRIRLNSGESVSIYNWQDGRSYCSTHECYPKGGYYSAYIIKWHVGTKSIEAYNKIMFIIGKQNIIRTCEVPSPYEQSTVLDLITGNWYKYIDEYYSNYGEDAYDFDSSANEFDKSYDRYHKYDKSYWSNLTYTLNKRYNAPITKLDYNEPGLFWGFLDFAQTKYSEYHVGGAIIDIQADATCIKRVDERTVLIRCINYVWVMKNTFYAQGDTATVGLTMMNKTHKDGTFMLGDNITMYQINHVRRTKRRKEEVRFQGDVKAIASDFDFAHIVSMNITKKQVTAVIDNTNASDGMCYALSVFYNKMCSLLNREVKIVIVKLNDDTFTATSKSTLTYEDTVPMVECGGAPCTDDELPSRTDGKEHQYCDMSTKGVIAKFITNSQGEPAVVVHIADAQSWVPKGESPVNWKIGEEVTVVFRVRNSTYDVGNTYVLDTFEVVDIMIHKK